VLIEVCRGGMLKTGSIPQKGTPPVCVTNHEGRAEKLGMVVTWASDQESFIGQLR
jgi:hypothetical protein